MTAFRKQIKETLTFIVFEWLKRNDPNSTTLYGLPFSGFR